MATVKINAVDRSTGYTNDELEAISLRYTAADGEVGQGTVPVPNPAGTTEPYAGQSFQLLVGATLLFDGFIGPLQRERGATATGTRLVDTYTTGDENAVLSGFRAYKWKRSAETTKARFLAFLAAFVPWVTDTTWVTNDVVENMPAKTYTTETLFSELFQEIKDLTGNTAFIENHRAHLHPPTLGIVGGLAFSDTGYDYATTLPLYNPRRSKDPIDLRDDVKVVTPHGSYTATDSTAIARYDAGGLKHQALVVLGSGTAAEAQTKAQAILADSKAERITYEFDTGPLTAAQLASIPVGCLVAVTSAVLGLSASTQRIAAMTVSYRVGDMFMAHIEMGFPVRIRKAPPRVGVVTPEPVASYARIDDPSDTYTGSLGGGSPIAWLYNGDNPHAGWASAPKYGLMDYDASSLNPGQYDPIGQVSSGIKMNGSGTIDIYCRVTGYWGMHGPSAGTLISIIKKGVATPIATRFLADSAPGIHIWSVDEIITVSGVEVASGDIIEVDFVLGRSEGDGMPGAAYIGATSTWMYATGDLTDLTEYTSDTSGDLAVPLEVVGILNAPIAGKTDGKGLVYDIATNTWIPGGTIDLESAGVSVVNPATVLNARHGLVADSSGNLDVDETALDGSLIPGITSGSGGTGPRGWDGEDGEDGEDGRPGRDGADGRIAYQDHGATGATETIDWSRDVHRLLLDTATVALSVANVPAAGTPAIVRLLLVADSFATCTALTWWAGITWVGGTAPTPPRSPGQIIAVDIQTVDGGSTYLGMVASGGSGSSSSGSAAAAMPLADPYGDDATSSLVQEVADSFMLGRYQGLQVEDTAGNRYGQVERLIVDRASILPGDGVQLRGLASGTIGASVYSSANRTLTTGAEQALTFDSELFDTDAFHSVSSNTDRFTVPAGLAGKYLVTLSLHTSSDPGGTAYASIKKNDTSIASLALFKGDASSHWAAVAIAILDLSAGDYVNFKYLAGSAGTLTGGTTWAPQASIVKLDSGRVGTGVGASCHNNAVAQSIPNSTWTGLTWTTEVSDTDGFHSTSVNTSRFTVPAGMGGKYLVSGNCALSTASATGARSMSILKNGTTFYGINGFHPQTTVGEQYGATSAILDLVPGDYVEVAVYQTSGGALNTTAQVYGSQGQIVRIDSVPSAAPRNIRVHKAANQTGIVANTWTKIALDTVDEDPSGMWDATNKRIVSPGTGIFIVTGLVSYLAATTGNRLAFIYKNGVGWAAYAGVPADNNTLNGAPGVVIPAIIPVVAGDYLELWTYQDSGGNQSVQTSSNLQAAFFG